MFTEPLTTPPTKNLQIIYGAIVGFLFCPQVHLGPLYTTPEIALLLGNVYSYSVSSKERLLLTLEKKVQVAPDIYDLVFSLSRKFSFVPGQYMEWTLPHKSPDSRGNRRYFTIASSPTENKMIVGIRFHPQGSSFKNSLNNLPTHQKIVAAQLSGDFTMPKNTSEKLVFIAGGIGVTPFRSMVKYLMDSREKRDIVLLYTAKSAKDFAYKEIFDEAAKRGIIRAVYTITDPKEVPMEWTGRVGRINETLIEKEIPDFTKRHFYLSGPNAMVESYEHLLKKMGVQDNHIKKDYFPGFA
jgi:ferredoxin-NADP reductase